MTDKPQTPDLTIAHELLGCGEDILQFKPNFAASFFRPIADSRRVYGKSKLRHIREILHYCLWQRLFTRADYYLYGFHKEACVMPERARRYVGNTRNVAVIRRVNHMNAVGRAVLHNKILTEIVLRTARIPTQPILAAYRPAISGFCGQVLSSTDDIAAFLRESDRYPLFGKPCDGVFSSGAVSLDSYRAATDSVLTRDGTERDVGRFVAEIAAEFPGGYLFQNRIAQHPSVTAISGQAVSSLRVFTINDGKRPIIHYTIWKVASPDSIADNSWRPGVAFCLVDPKTGQTTRAAVLQNGVGTKAANHPTIGIPLVGLKVPMWLEVQKLALRAAVEFADLPMIGWDIALREEGPIIIEGAEDPGPSLYQMVMEDGVLSENFMEMISKIEIEQRAATAKRRQRPSRLERLRERLRKFDLLELFR